MPRPLQFGTIWPCRPFLERVHTGFTFIVMSQMSPLTSTWIATTCPQSSGSTSFQRHCFIGRSFCRFDGRAHYFCAPCLVSQAAARHGRATQELENSRWGLRHPLAGFGRRPQYGGPAPWRASASPLSKCLTLILERGRKPRLHLISVCGRVFATPCGSSFSEPALPALS